MVHMVNFLGADEPDVRTAAYWARATLTRLGARPYLERLQAGLLEKVKRPTTRTAPGARTRTETPAG